MLCRINKIEGQLWIRLHRNKSNLVTVEMLEGELAAEKEIQQSSDMRLRLVCFWLLLALFARAESDDGELRLKVTDPNGHGLQATVEITSAANEVKSEEQTNESGVLVLHHLAFGTYNVRVQRDGFEPQGKAVEVRSAIPQEITAELAIATKKTTVEVEDKDTLLDPERTGSAQRIGNETIAMREGSLPGRSVQELVNEQPGWLFEGNAVLHPRGSEYQIQLVVDGVPLTENRSPGLGPEMEADDIASMNVYTSNYPAEYGRKLGGVIEITTARDVRLGLHGKVELEGGSFDTRNGDAQVQYGWGANTLTVSGDGGATNWYLNPPVTQDFTNRGTDGALAAHYEREIDANDRLGVSVRHEQSRFEVPNEFLQQAAGQRQDRGNDETAGVLTFQHIFSANLLADLRLMARSTDATLTSNALATPIIAGQQRSYDEQYAKAAISYHHGAQEWKAGVEADFATIDEQFDDAITNFAQFDPGTPASFAFRGSAPDREQSLFVQDHVHLGEWTASVGLRWDHYRLLNDESAASPRIGVARYFKRFDLVVHASYDRVFQTPAMENLLLASSPMVTVLNAEVLRLPVKPSLGNFYEAGVSKEIGGALRADVSYFRRDVNNFADDDLLLNTSVSFPIAFRRATINGAEAKMELPRWKRLSGWVSYSYMQGTAFLPVTGGLFLGDEATQAIAQSRGSFPISQDQRNTLRTRFEYGFTSRIWVALGAQYGSGLPVEFDGNYAQAVAQYGQQIVDRVNFERGRVKPNLAVDASVGAELWKHEKKALNIQADVENLNNRLNLINFAGLFSGNSIAPPRSWHLRMRVEF